MTPNEILAWLQFHGDEKVRKHNLRWGADTNQYGVKLGEIRRLAKIIKTNHSLSIDLWKTVNLDARLLAVLVMDPKKLSAEALEAIVKSATVSLLADWLNAYMVKFQPDKESLRQKRMHATDSMTVCAGWSLTSGRVAGEPEGLPHFALLHPIETKVPEAAHEVQWTMNSILAFSGIPFPQHRQKAIAIGEEMGDLS